ncbi:ABC transporter permease [Bacillus aquiflavi]|uniref:ABC transporter permease n=1 Tax=Bacillus aquiflavi TaxID=2672567 RepID=A0A6B3VX02_9BACI|nr:ABC transporter permease [Bacillus aquiflavi]MBA4535660.1 ABC transporter permease [Bacillus aquiflavi]NEY80036.1 ABC transporter permease [Bacillus aquiflavi]
MNNFWIILFHTFTNKLKTKSFIITTAIMVGIIFILGNLTNIINFFNKEEDVNKIAVIEETGNYYDLYKQNIEEVNDDIQLVLFEGTVDEAIKAVKDGKFEGVIHVTANEDQLPAATYKAMTVADSTLATELESGLQQVKTMLAAKQANLTEAQMNKIYEPVQFEKIPLQKNAKTEEELNQARGLVYALLFIIYIAVLMYSSMIAMEVATEKSSRVMEILISSVSPITQMFAKIFGIALLGLTQFIVLIAAGYVAIRRNLQGLEDGFFSYMGFGETSIETLIYAVVFFMLGYLLYATLAAFLGSLVSRIEDVQQLISPMTFLVIIGFMIAMFGLGEPESTFITITSFIPFFTPMIMFLRVGMLSIPFWEIALSIGLLVTTIIILAVFGARVYRGGVLMYGKSSSFKDIKKALQLTKKE